VNEEVIISFRDYGSLTNGWLRPKWNCGCFEFVNQDGQGYGLDDLDGKIWVADFIFTNCADICPPMTANMLKLQDMVKEEKLDNVEFISFSVDPAVDTPEVLREYGERFSVDFSSWNFLTGYKQEEIEAFAMDTFKTIVKKPEEGDQVIHQSYFYLVDQNGNIMKSYSGLNDTPFDLLEVYFYVHVHISVLCVRDSCGMV
jgi:protein SCO1/2